MPQASRLTLSIVIALTFACVVFVFEASFFSPTPAVVHEKIVKEYYNSTEIVKEYHNSTEIVVVKEPVFEAYRLDSDLGDNTHVHIVYTTSCNQGNRLFFSSGLQLSLSRVGHRGPVTEIVHGCTPEEIESFVKLPTFYYDFTYHFAPDYAQQGKDYYTPYNKPFGLRHFLHSPDNNNDMAIALIDLDYVFFKPLRINTGAKWGKYYQSTKLRRNEDITDTVAPGFALAQNMKAVVGGRWFNNYNATMKTIICGGLPCINVSNDDAFEYYEPTGTPYILTRPDWIRMVDDYANFTVKGRLYQNDWMVEMYAYGAAAANQNINHTLLKHLGPQTCNHPNTEYWDFIDENFPNPCEDPVALALPDDPPIAIHNAMYYGVGNNVDKGYWYSKHRLPRDLTDCESMMIQLPPATEWTKIKSMDITDEEKMIKRHHVWMECTMIKYSNIVLTDIKTRMCPKGFNSRRGLILEASNTRHSAHETKTNSP